jgi:hypothetical protein
MSVKRYKNEDDGYMSDCELGDHVLATDYDALLVLAKKLRGALIFDYGREPLSNGTVDQNCQCAKCKALRDSAWLEEREE